MLSVNGDAGTAATVKICSGTGWFKFRSMASRLIAKHSSFIADREGFTGVRGDHLKQKQAALHQAEMKMITWMCGVKLRAELFCTELKQWLGIEKFVKVIQ